MPRMESIMLSERLSIDNKGRVSRPGGIDTRRLEDRSSDTRAWRYCRGSMGMNVIALSDKDKCRSNPHLDPESIGSADESTDAPTSSSSSSSSSSVTVSGSLVP